jgi:hypothetical protein
MKSFSLLVIVIVFLLASFVVNAGEITPMRTQPIVATAMDKRTHPETIVMVAYKLAKKEPSYEQWAPLSPNVEKADSANKETVQRNEMMRLKVGFDTLDITQPIVIQTKISLDKYSTLTGVMGLPEFNSRTYFKYSMYGQNIAIVPKDIVRFSKLQIDQNTINDFLTKTSGNRELLGEILIRPLVSDMNSPFVDEGYSYNLLMGDIAEFRLWGAGSAGPVLLWFYRADWYKPRENKDLLDLKSNLAG